MDYALLVCRREAMSGLKRVIQCLSNRQCRAAHHVSERFTLEQLGHDVCGSIERVYVVDRENVWMV